MKKSELRIMKRDQEIDNWIPTLKLERGESLQELFNRLPTTIYERAVDCIGQAMEDMKNNKRPEKVILFYLGEVDIVEVPISGWILCLKNAEKHFAEVENYEKCTKIVELLNPLEDAITV